MSLTRKANRPYWLLSIGLLILGLSLIVSSPFDSVIFSVFGILMLPPAKVPKMLKLVLLIGFGVYFFDFFIRTELCALGFFDQWNYCN